MQKVYRVTGWILVVVAACVVLLRMVALRWWQLPFQADDPELAASVGPSLQGGDWVLLWRLTRPGLGDLVVCPDPDDASNVVIARIAAEAGDRIVIEGQAVEINGERPHIEYNCTEQTFSLVDPDTTKDVDVYCDMEEIGEKLHARGHGGVKSTKRRFEKEVEPGKVFLLSDNRVYPFDSRHFGTIDRAGCSETVFFRLVSERGFFDQKRRLTFVR